MNEEDQKLIELYLQDEKKKKIIFLIVFIFLSVFLIGISYIKQTTNNDSNNVENIDINEINSQSENNEIIKNEVTENNEDTISKQEPTTNEKNTQNNEVEQPQQESKENKQEKQSPTNTSSTTTKKEETSKIQKTANKDFLFTDGYNMDNVSQAAESYLKSSGYPGKCIPLKDGEGIYIGMRVVFD